MELLPTDFEFPENTVWPFGKTPVSLTKVHPPAWRTNELWKMLEACKAA